jgi:hypothetical protein
MPQWRIRRQELNAFIASPMEEGAAGGTLGD